ncbi:MAG TPA: aminotransferase class IV [Opitutaceae bacterium]|nr:aminotransferase class IV [Opitutaceae bacterium]
MNGFLRHVVLNGRLTDAADALISPLSEGFMYGQGVFETVKVLHGRPVFFLQHFERLRRSAEALGLAPGPAAEELRECCGRCLAANGLEEGGLKIMVFRQGDGTGRLVAARPLSYSKNKYEEGFAVKTLAGVRHGGGLFAWKTLNYLENFRAKQAAQAAGADEALFVGTNRLVLEGATTNVFVVIGGEVLTPPADGCILPGIVRQQVLRLGRVREAPLLASLLFEAEEVFLTNALLGVMPVREIDHKAFDLASNPVTRGMAAALRGEQLRSVGQTG